MPAPRRNKLQTPALMADREQLDKLDARIRELLTERYRIVETIGEEKLANQIPVYDPRREQEIVQQISSSCEPLSRRPITSVWRTILRGSREIQYGQRFRKQFYPRWKQEMETVPRDLGQINRIAYVGSSESQLAAQIRGRYPGADPVPSSSFHSAFTKLMEETVDYLLLPLEDSVIGSFREVYQLLPEHGVFFIESYTVKQPYQLFVQPGVKLSNIRTVVAHPQVLVDCAPLINKMGWNRIEEQTFYGAIRKATMADPGVAAIVAGEEASQHGLEALSTTLPQERCQVVRYVLVGRKLTLLPGWNRATLRLQIPNQPQTLVHALAVVGDHGLNMQKLRTETPEDQPWNQIVLLELEVNQEESAEFLMALSILQMEFPSLRILGLYPHHTK